MKKSGISFTFIAFHQNVLFKGNVNFHSDYDASEGLGVTTFPRLSSLLPFHKKEFQEKVSCD